MIRESRRRSAHAVQPVIGITTSFESGEQRLHPAYAQAVERSGGLPVLIPLYRERETVEALLSIVDGVVIPGGPAIVEGMIK